jgi:hypothetical protein
MRLAKISYVKSKKTRVYRFNMPANDNRSRMKMPQKQIDTNKFIEPAKQNT